jgi:integrase
VQTPRADLAEFDLIDPELRKAAFRQFDAHTFLGARNQAILALLSDCGVRRDELCILKDADVDLTDMQVRVYAPKTRHTRWRLVPFSEETAAVLANYVRLRERYQARSRGRQPTTHRTRAAVGHRVVPDQPVRRTDARRVRCIGPRSTVHATATAGIRCSSPARASVPP